MSIGPGTPAPRAHDFRIVPAGDSTLLVEFENRIDSKINARAIGLAATLGARRIAGVRDIVPTFCSVAVHFDPVMTDAADLERQIRRHAVDTRDDDQAGAATISVPVHYGGDAGPDLPDVARFAGLSEDEVIALHSTPLYRVFMLGFLPGFAYMGIVDERIAAPRRSSPRTHVPRGSVGIAGRQTGVYPADTPGGWLLIGRTVLEPFDPNRAAPFLFNSGDRIQFVPAAR